MTPSYSVVIPTFRCTSDLEISLQALHAAGVEAERITVVDDASKDGTADVARRFGVRTIELDTNLGAGPARNRGAAGGTEDVIVFVDADVRVHPDAISRLLSALATCDAVFGSYDAEPAAPGRVSRFRNLFHHWIHQEHDGPIASFWTGLGAVRRAAFDAVGGFDENLRFMEDVELGIRLDRAGYCVTLEPKALGTHLKRWTLKSMLRCDLVARAIPWSRLILSPENKETPAPLTAGPRGKLSVLAVAVSLIAAALSLVSPWWLALSVASIGLIGVLHWDFLKLLRKTGKTGDASIGVGLLWLVYLMAGLGFAYVLVERRLGRPTG